MFYTYLWLREDGTPYYVGKGSGNRAHNPAGHRVRKPTEKERILVQEHISEEEALFSESFFISMYGRLDLGTGCLSNLTDGGENPPSRLGFKHTKETCRKMSRSHKGKPSGMLGKCQTEAQKLAMKLNHTGKKVSEETRKRMSAALKGRVVSEDTKRKQSLAKLGRKRSLFTEETRLRMREAQKLRRAMERV